MPLVGEGGSGTAKTEYDWGAKTSKPPASDANVTKAWYDSSAHGISNAVDNVAAVNVMAGLYLPELGALFAGEI